MSVSPNPGVIEFAEFIGPTGGQQGVSGNVPAPDVADAAKFLRGDGTWQAVSGGGGGGTTVTTGATIVNFGSEPGTSYVITTVETALVASSSVVTAWVAGGVTESHNDYEHMLAPVTLRCGNIVDAVSFDVVATTDHRLTGTFNVHWMVI